MQQLAQASYQPYVARIGRRPAPMTADYTAIAISGTAWVAEQSGRLVGLLVLEPAEDHLLLDNVAVAPQEQGVGVGSRIPRNPPRHRRRLPSGLLHQTCRPPSDPEAAR